MQRRLLPIAVLAACGGNHVAPPDGGSNVPVVDAPAVSTVEFTPACETVSQPKGTPFATAADVPGEITPGTLAAWDPSGRWFLTGTEVSGISSFHFDKTAGGIVVDRDSSVLGTLDGDALFQRTTEAFQGGTFTQVIRVSNLAADGSLRAERVQCDGGQCEICTAKLIRATHNADEGEGSGISLVGQLDDPSWGDGYTFNVRVEGTLAYLIRQDGLHIIETVDPANPVELGHYQRSGDGYSNDVKLVDAAGGKRYAIIADFPVDVVDVTDPTKPVLAGNIQEQAHTLFTVTAGGKTLGYFGNYDANCPVYDLTDPAAPKKLGTFHTTGQLVHDLYVEGTTAYLNAWDAGYQVVDFSNPAAPKRTGLWTPTPTLTSHSNWVAHLDGGGLVGLHGEEAYAAHMTLVDVDPASPTFMGTLGEWKTRDWVSIHDIMAFGNKAYLTHYQDGVRVLDVSNPAAPVQLGYYNTWDPQADYTSSDFFEGAVGLDVDLTRKLIFVADSPRGLLILKDDTAN